MYKKGSPTGTFIDRRVRPIKGGEAGEIHVVSKYMTKTRGAVCATRQYAII